MTVRRASAPMPITAEAEAFERVERAVRSYEARVSPDEKRALFALRQFLRGRARDLRALAEQSE